MKPFFDVNALRKWFLENKRPLPWRLNQDPYRIWVSEVMLQQTQVAVVIPYFERWMLRFPSLESLAKAHLDEVLKLWEGLGYYSRARNLYEGARYLVEHFGGCFPNAEEDLIKIKGLGPYTVGAILSFAFHQKKAAVDGNVMRVLARYYADERDISKAVNQKEMRKLIQELLPDEKPWEIMEAMIELGAMVCMKKASCGYCPLQTSCESFRQGLTNQFPIKSQKAATELLYRTVAVISCQEHYLIRRGEKGKVMQDLYEFPFFSHSSEGMVLSVLIHQIKQSLGLIVFGIGSLKQVKHSFTRFRVHLFPFQLVCNERIEVEGFTWIPAQDLKNHPFSSGHRRILHELEMSE